MDVALASKEMKVGNLNSIKLHARKAKGGVAYSSTLYNLSVRKWVAI